MVRRGAWKLIETFDPAGFELYDLGTDLGETRNLAAAEPARLAELRRELEDWRRAVGAEMMTPNPDHDPAFQPVQKGKKRKAGQ